MLNPTRSLVKPYHKKQPDHTGRSLGQVVEQD